MKSLLLVPSTVTWSEMLVLPLMVKVLVAFVKLKVVLTGASVKVPARSIGVAVPPLARAMLPSGVLTVGVLLGRGADRRFRPVARR